MFIYVLFPISRVKKNRPGAELVLVVLLAKCPRGDPYQIWSNKSLCFFKDPKMLVYL